MNMMLYYDWGMTAVHWQSFCSVALSSPGWADAKLTFSSLWHAENVLAAIQETNNQLDYSRTSQDKVASSSHRQTRPNAIGSTVWNYYYTQEHYLLLANDDSLWVGIDGVDGVAHWALDVHEEGVWRLDLSLKLMLGGLVCGINVKKIDFHVCSQTISANIFNNNTILSHSN